MECSDCQRKMLLFKCKDGEYRCLGCKRLNEVVQPIEEKEVKEGYVVRWKLRDHDGKEWIEEMEGMTLSDFEVAYGNITQEILWCTLRLRCQALI